MRQFSFKELKVTYIIMALCLLIFAVINLRPMGLSKSAWAVLLGAYYRPFLLAGEYWRLLTVGFVHVDVWHVLMNMTALYNLGSMLERRYGAVRYTAVLLISVVCGSLFMAAAGDTVLAVGLSGGLYGLMGAYLAMLWRMGVLRNPAVRSGLIRTLGINLMINFMPGIAYMAHAGGFIAGVLMGLALEPQSSQAMKRNCNIALVLYAACMSLLVFTKPVLRDDTYQGFDLGLLVFESQHGLKNHAVQMAKRLDALYDTDYMEQYLTVHGG